VKNQVYTGTPTSRRFALCPSTVVAGDAVLIGQIPAVALDTYSSVTLGTTFLTNGTFTLTVIAATVVSPITGSACNPGDKIYATGTLDATTNVTTGLTLSKASGGTLFGRLDPAGTAITSGTTDTAASVVLTEGI
jgi:predicted RecA/RadA family phage recombinase